MCLWFWVCALFSECNVSQVVWVRGAPQTSEVGGEGTPQQALSPLQMGTEETAPHSGVVVGGWGSVEQKQHGHACFLQNKPNAGE